jgi:hypothetical protein
MPLRRLQRTRAAYESRDFDRGVSPDRRQFPVLRDRDTAIEALARAIARASAGLRQMSRPMP